MVSASYRTTMTTEQQPNIVLQHKIIESKITSAFTKRPGFFVGWTLEDKKELLALEEKEMEAIRVYMAEFKRRFPSGSSLRADGSNDDENFPAEESRASKLASDAKWNFIKQRSK